MWTYLSPKFASSAQYLSSLATSRTATLSISRCWPLRLSRAFDFSASSGRMKFSARVSLTTWSPVCDRRRVVRRAVLAEQELEDVDRHVRADLDLAHEILADDPTREGVVRQAVERVHRGRRCSLHHRSSSTTIVAATTASAPPRRTPVRASRTSISTVVSRSRFVVTWKVRIGGGLPPEAPPRRSPGHSHRRRRPAPRRRAHRRPGPPPHRDLARERSPVNLDRRGEGPVVILRRRSRRRPGTASGQRRLGIDDEHRDDQLLGDRPPWKNCFAPPALNTARPVARSGQDRWYPGRRQRNAQRALRRCRALADPSTTVKVAASSRGRIDRPMRPETAGQRHEPVVGCDHDPRTPAWPRRATRFRSRSRTVVNWDHAA